MSAADMLDGVLVAHGACPNCQHPVNDQGLGPDNGWIHTVTGTYRCPADTAPDGDGFVAPPVGTDAIEAAVDKAIADTEQVYADTHYTEDEVREKTDEATLAGRTAMHAELDAALSAVFDTVSVHGAATAAEAERILRAALASAWNQVAP